MRTFGGHDFSFGVLRKFCVQWLFSGGEGAPEFPWQADGEELGPLALPPGVTWGDDARRSLRITYFPYELGTGIADDMNGQPGMFWMARHYRIFVDATDALPFVVSHPMKVFPPHVQLVEQIVGVTDVWRLYDIHGAGGTIDFDENSEDIIIDPGAAWQGFVVIVG